MKVIHRIYILAALVGGLFLSSCAEEQIISDEIENVPSDPDNDGDGGTPPPPTSFDD